MIRLADYAHAHGLPYYAALDLVLRRVVPARRVGARWYVVESDDRETSERVREDDDAQPARQGP